VAPCGIPKVKAKFLAGFSPLVLTETVAAEFGAKLIAEAVTAPKPAAVPVAPF